MYRIATWSIWNLTFCLLLLVTTPAVAKETDGRFPLVVNGLEMSRGGFHALLRQNSLRMGLVKIHFRHHGLDYSPSTEQLVLTRQTTKTELTEVAERALALRLVLENYFNPTADRPKLEGQALVDALRSYARQDTETKDQKLAESLPTTPVKDERFPLLVEGLRLDQIQFHAILAQNSWWLQYESEFLQNEDFAPAFTDLSLRADTPAAALAELVVDGLRLRSIIARFKKYRETMPVDRLRTVLIAYQEDNQAELQSFFDEFPLKPETVSLRLE